MTDSELDQLYCFGLSPREPNAAGFAPRDVWIHAGEILKERRETAETK